MSIQLLMMGALGAAAAPPGGGSIEYVGGATFTANGGTTPLTGSLTSLSGGLASAPAENDFVIVMAAHANEGAAATTPAMNTSGYTQEASVSGVDYYRVNMVVWRKFMGSTPDTSFEVTNTGDGSDPVAAVVHVWRGVNQTTPMDVTTTTASGIDTGQANPPSITPVTSGAVVVACGASPATGAPGSVFTSSDLSNFLSVSANDTKPVVVGMGSVAWSSGAVDPAQFGGSATSTTLSWAAATMALRPA